MIVTYKNNIVEKITIAANILTAAVVVASFVLLYGFYEQMLPSNILHIIQTLAFLIFLSEKIIRFFNAESKKEFFRANWFEIPLLLILIMVIWGAGKWFAVVNPAQVKITALGVYLIFQVVAKACRSCVNLASSGRNPTKTLLLSFLVLIFAGAGMLMLPRSYNTVSMSFTDAVFTATSATCVTGLVVKDTGQDFTTMGQVTILTLIQLGGLGIVVFGAVLALLLGQALSVRESVAMQDLLNAQTLGRIGNMIGFIFTTTILIEAIGVVLLYRMWDGSVDIASSRQQWFFSIFHSISAFCNAGFGLYSDSLMGYDTYWQVYAVFCPLIILGGLGFGVLYNLTNVTIFVCN